MTIRITVTSPQTDKQALACLFQNIELIEQNKELILSTSEYRDIYISGVGVYALYIPPLKLFLGDLLRLWEQTPWKQENEYFYYTTGSPLSGSNCSSLWSKAGGFNSKHIPSIGALLKPAYLLVNTGTTNQTANYVSVNVPKREVSKLNIYDLVEKLKALQVHDHEELSKNNAVT